MKDMNKLIEKVTKLLALAGNNPSENEAQAAALKAQRLIAEYNLDLNALGMEEKIEYKLLTAVHSNNEGYRSPLATIVAPNFRCRAILINNHIHFFGRAGDVDTCTSVYNYLYKVSHNKGLRLERQARKEGRSTHGVANCYWRGFMKGLQDELATQCQALAIVVPEDVHSKFSEKFPKLTQHKGGIRQRGFDVRAYDTGYKDGRDSMKRRELEG